MSVPTGKGTTMTEAHDRQIRKRISVSISTRGVHTWDCTVEDVSPDGISNEALLAESDALVAALESRYPVTGE